MTMHSTAILEFFNQRLRSYHIYPIEQKLDGRLLATWGLRNSYNHPICISKIA